MFNTLGLVQVQPRVGPTLRKIGRKLGGKSVLEWVVRRFTDCQRLDAVVVVPAAADQYEQIRRLVPSDVGVLESICDDPLTNVAAALERFPSHCVVRLCGESLCRSRADRPAGDHRRAHPGCDYISYCCADGRPAILTQLGVFAEWCSSAALQRAAREARAARPSGSKSPPISMLTPSSSTSG